MWNIKLCFYIVIDDYFFLQKKLVITHQENASGISLIQAELHRLLDKIRFNSKTGPLKDPNCLTNLKTLTVILLFFSFARTLEMPIYIRGRLCI